MIRSRRGKDIGIAGPAQALIPLGAVRRQIDEVRLLAPEGVFNQAVYLGIIRLEETRLHEVRVEDRGPEGLRRDLSRPARHPDIAESIVGEVLGDNLRPVVRNVYKFRLGLPVIVPVEISFLQNFSELECKDGPGFHSSRNVDLQKARVVLSEVQDRLASGRRNDFPYIQYFMRPDIGRHPVLKMRKGKGCCAGLLLRGNDNCRLSHTFSHIFSRLLPRLISLVYSRLLVQCPSAIFCNLSGPGRKIGWQA